MAKPKKFGKAKASSVSKRSHKESRRRSTPATSGPGSTPSSATPGGGAAAPAPAFQTFRDRRLSLWQSIVEQSVARRAQKKSHLATGSAKGLAARLDLEKVRLSPESQAATALAATLNEGKALVEPPPAPKLAKLGLTHGVVSTAWKCNKLAFQLAWAKATGNTQAAQELSDELNYSSCDPLWAECAEQYALFFVKDQGNIPYRSGGDYVLDVALPSKATVGIFGDWGTGTPAAVAVLEQIARKKPDIVFHLGDIYYSGMQAEVQARFLDICSQVLGNTPVFSLSGNHDMYSGGAGYYWLVDQLGQQASYFCVHNDRWQFQAMDTGYSDFNPFHVGGNLTKLTAVEAAWHQSKIDAAAANHRRVVLLSHHQPFSAYEAIGQQPTNDELLGVFQGKLSNVDVWFWGHEHRLTIYEPYQDVKRGRCVGCSAIPVFVENDSYEPKFAVPLVPDPNQPGQPIMLGNNGTVFNHAYAVMRLEDDQAEIAYYQSSDEQNAMYAERIKSS